MLMEILMDALLDCIKTLPFLLAAFLLVEWFEHKAGHFFQDRMGKAGRLGPVVGALLGCVPQCGFSVMAANLYSAGIVTAGTLIAVFASTSDEAVLILMSDPGQFPVIGKLILCKVIIAIIAGFVLDLAIIPMLRWNKKEIHDMCGHCGCGNGHGIWKPALNHTIRVFVYLFVISAVLGGIMETIGEEGVARLFLGDSMLQPFMTALVGLIPNCAASVIMTQLLMEGVISFGSAIAGLVSGAGVGLLVLLKTNTSRKESICLVAMLYAAACISGILLNLL